MEKSAWTDTLIGIVLMVSPPSKLGSITWGKYNITHFFVSDDSRTKIKKYYMIKTLLSGKIKRPDSEGLGYL